VEYGLLIGSRFVVDGIGYEIAEVVELGTDGVVKAVREPDARQPPQSSPAAKLFRLSHVLEALIPDEVIEIDR
jgi:hypothetical protein